MSSAKRAFLICAGIAAIAIGMIHALGVS